MSSQNVIVKCDHCGARNRIPAERIRERPVCGKCRQPLSTAVLFPDHPVHIDDRNFNSEVLNFRGSVVVFFWAAWCAHCQRLIPVIDQLAAEYAGRIKFVKIHSEQNPLTTARYDVMGLPTLLFFKGGKQVNRLFGALPKEQLEYHLSALL